MAGCLGGPASVGSHPADAGDRRRSGVGDAPHLRISNDTRVFFGEDNPEYQRLKALEHVYSREQSVFFVVAPHDGNVFTRRTLTAVTELTEAGWQVPCSTVVNSITNFQSTRAEGDDLIVENLVPDPCGLSDSDLQRIRRTALAETTLINMLLSRTGHVTGVHIGFATPEDRPPPTAKIAQYVRDLATDFRMPVPGHRLLRHRLGHDR